MLFIMAMSLASLLQTNCDVASIQIAKQPLNVEVANTPVERDKGLMRRQDLAPFDGMIFAYDTPRHVRFWMKDTPLSLDMFFFDASGQQISRQRDAVPFDRTPIEGGSNVQYVVELEAGRQAGILAAQNPKLELKACLEN